jgi:hypothetical protein
MDILSFSLGMSAVLVAILVGGSIVSFVKVNSLSKEITNIHTYLERNSRDVTDEFSSVNRRLDTGIDYLEREMRIISTDYNDRIYTTNSTMDSRFDKMDNRIKEVIARLDNRPTIVEEPFGFKN